MKTWSQYLFRTTIASISELLTPFCVEIWNSRWPYYPHLLGYMAIGQPYISGVVHITQMRPKPCFSVTNMCCHSNDHFLRSRCSHMTWFLVPWFVAAIESCRLQCCDSLHAGWGGQGTVLNTGLSLLQVREDWPHRWQTWHPNLRHLLKWNSHSNQYWCQWDLFSPINTIAQLKNKAKVGLQAIVGLNNV